MENNKLCMSMIDVIKEIILQPAALFNRVKNGQAQKEILIIFCISALITLLKSFTSQQQHLNYFSDERLNLLLSILSIPQVKWIVIYLIYFTMVCLVFVICKLISKSSKLKVIVYAFMSLSGIGILAQMLFYVMHFVISRNVGFIGGYCIYFWIIILSIRAVQITQDFSLLKAILTFLPPAIILAIGFEVTVVTPYLAWLNT